MHYVEKGLFTFALLLGAFNSQALDLAALGSTSLDHGRIQVVLPRQLSQSEATLSAPSPSNNKLGFFRTFQLGLGFAVPQPLTLPSSTPVSLEYKSTYVPQVWAQVDTKPLWSRDRLTLGGFVALEWAYLKSQATLQIAHNSVTDQEQLFKQGLGVGTELQYSLGQASSHRQLGLAASVSTLAAFSTAGLRSDAVTHWGQQERVAFRFYQQFSLANLMLELHTTREHLSSSTRMLQGLRIGVSKDL